MKLLTSVFAGVLMSALLQSVFAVEIHAPWSPGEQWDYDRTTSSWHSGVNDNCVDFNKQGGTDQGSPILAAGDGEVTSAGWSNSYGWHVWIHQADGTDCIYAHMAYEPVVKKQEHIPAGQVIGFCGCTPDGPNGTYCTGPHLHFGKYSGGESQLITRIDGQDVSQGSMAYSYNTGPLDLRKSAALNDRNEYASSQSPDQWFTGGTAGSIGWYHSYNPNYLYESGTNTAVNCYRSIYSGGTYVGAIVYDALGGARHAYCVGYQYWAKWDNLATSCTGDCPTPTCGDGGTGVGGPNSVLGMPITNHYQYTVSPEHWRQDFEKGYIEDGTIVKCYPISAPGWTSSGWNNQYSYLYADAYDRNGGRRDVGNAEGTVHVENASYSNILVQHFSGGNDLYGGMIMYDTENWECNPQATNEAYWVYGDIMSHYDELGGVSYFGCATIDRFTFNGRVCQDFKNSAGTQHRIYETGTPAVDLLGTCSGGTYEVAGSGSSESFAGLTLTPITGDWDGDAVFEVGVYADETQTFYLDLNNDGYTDLELHYSSAVDKPLAGDWDGNAYYSVGFYRPAYRTFWMDYDNNGQMDYGFNFGDGGDTPLAGDWLGNGYTRIGVYRPSTRTFWLDHDNNGTADFSVTFGDNGDIPLVGDWDCDLDWNIGIYRPSTRTFWLDYDNDHVADFSRTYGDNGDIPIVGDWTGNCGTNIGIYRPSTQEFWLDYNSDGYADRCIVIRRTIPGSPKITTPGEDNTLPLTFSLSQNYPNPFNPATTISYSLPYATHVSLDVYNILGQKVATLVNEKQEAGDHTAQWDGKYCSSGVYLYRISTDQAVETKKMLLLK